MQLAVTLAAFFTYCIVGSFQQGGGTGGGGWHRHHHGRDYNHDNDHNHLYDGDHYHLYSNYDGKMPRAFCSWRPELLANHDHNRSHYDHDCGYYNQAW
ncbi:hypothetical protein AAVH_11387 [Aphelenchoides avenae]|nr:hypothetical protein AAVH_11387 [Aphelenchus avenae]